MSNLKIIDPAKARLIAANKKAELEKLLLKSNKAVIEMYKKVPLSAQRLFLDVFVGKSTQKKRIKLKCLDCSAWQKEEIKDCPVYTCPLHEIRPYQNK